jgi:hypothetical protein
MIKTLFILGLSVAATIYAATFLTKMVFRDPAPFVLECVGVALDPFKTYAISNSVEKSEGRLVIDYPPGKAVLPRDLGTLA